MPLELYRPEYASMLKIVRHFSATEELSFYNCDNCSVTLTFITNTPAEIERIKREINAITTRYRLINLYPNEKLTDIKILDIDV